MIKRRKTTKRKKVVGKKLGRLTSREIVAIEKAGLRMHHYIVTAKKRGVSLLGRPTLDTLIIEIKASSIYVAEAIAKEKHPRFQITDIR